MRLCRITLLLRFSLYNKYCQKDVLEMIVYTQLSSLEADLGISAKTLYSISNSINKRYKEVAIPKSDGGVRKLSVPDEALKNVQRRIVDKLLIYEPVSIYAKAYKQGADVKKNAACHVGKENLLKLDIYKFFDNINYSTVKDKVFPKERYSEEIRILLALLCYRGESLPQGAPTSPIISNIIMRDFDRTLGEWCRERKIAYTRYCDDMTFSGNIDRDEVVEFVSAELRKMGFILNGRKTRFLKQGQRKTVTGIVVNDKLNAKKDYKREIRQELYYCNKFGVSGHLTRVASPDTPKKYLLRMLGKVNFIIHIEPENCEFHAYKQLILKLINEEKNN